MVVRRWLRSGSMMEHSTTKAQYFKHRRYDGVSHVACIGGQAGGICGHGGCECMERIRKRLLAKDTLLSVEFMIVMWRLLPE